MSKHKSRVLYLSLVLLLTAFIWGNSLQSATVSDEASGWVLALIQNIIDTLSLGAIHLTNHIVRKAAHLTEFALQGACLAAALHAYGNNIRAALLLGCATAIIDEGIQSFTPGRSCQLSDVLLDTVGSGIGMLVVSWWNRRKNYEKSLK